LNEIAEALTSYILNAPSGLGMTRMTMAISPMIINAQSSFTTGILALSSLPGS
jgi:hypothetical protein